MKKILLFILLFPFQLLIAQNEMRVVGNGEFQPSELIDKSIRDANGEVCAGLMIVTDLTGMRYDSYNGIVKVNQNPGKDFLFLSPDERVVEIFCNGFASLKIILSDYGIALKKGEVWKLKVTGDKLSDLININILVKPTDAQIYIDDKLQNNSAIQVSAGSHKIKIIKEGYQTIEENIDVAVGKTLFNYTLSEIELVGVQISSIPNGAKIYINGLEKGETNKGLFLYPGVYLLKLSKSGYLDKEEKITVGSNKQNNFTYNLEKNAGTLNISVTPSNATVLINKEKFTQKNIELPTGKYKIEISENGYYDQNETIEIELGKTINKSFNLKPKVGKLQFSVSPIEANITLSKNGKVVESWQGLKMLKDLQVGEYELVIVANGYKTVNKSITIKENESIIEEISLSTENDVPVNFVYVEGGELKTGSKDMIKYKIGIVGFGYNYGWTSGDLSDYFNLSNIKGLSIFYIFKLSKVTKMGFSMDYYYCYQKDFDDKKSVLFNFYSINYLNIECFFYDNFYVNFMVNSNGSCPAHYLKYSLLGSSPYGLGMGVGYDIDISNYTVRLNAINKVVKGGLRFFDLRISLGYSFYNDGN